MALPTSRDFDAVDAGPLPHATVNNIQDAIVSHEAELRAQYQMTLSIYDGQPDDETQGIYNVPNGTHIATNVGLRFKWNIPLLEGDRILSLKVFFDGAAGDVVKNINLYKRTGAVGAATLVDNQSGSAIGDGFLHLFIGLPAVGLIAADQFWYLEWLPGEVGDAISGMILSYDRTVP